MNFIIHDLYYPLSYVVMLTRFWTIYLHYDINKFMSLQNSLTN